MNKQQATDTVGKYLELLFSDYPAAAEMMTDDFVWENHLPPHVPFGGRYEGASGLKDYIDQLAAAWVVGDIVFHDFIYDPETRILAVPGVEQLGKALPTGRTCDMDFMWEFRFSGDGQISYVREYNDTATIGATFDS